MTMAKRVELIVLAGILGLLSLAVSERSPIPMTSGFVTTAQAVVGRPLTPVSVAGVARRTVRRCAVGVYNC
jgi:hypothetical protein